MGNDARRKYWGWGYEGEGLNAAQTQALSASLAARYGVNELPQAAPPTLDQLSLRAPRITAPASLDALLTTDHYERVLHSFGRSLPDSIRLYQRDIAEPPDMVGYPRTEDDVVALLDWADGANVAVIPFGGGSSVCGGVEPDVGDSYKGTLSLDLLHLNQVLEIDRESRAARIQGGAKGPEFEAQLKPHGYTLRHFPQSFSMASIGGMIATRSGGHFATLYTHIDDFVESTRCVTPQGVMESRRLPGSGAGPSPDRLLLGSEGALGIITEAWLRIQDRPTFRASKTVFFDDFYAGAGAVRALSQAALFPSNCRLIDANEAASSGASSAGEAMLVLGFESADHPVEHKLARALELVADHGGRFQDKDQGHRDGAAGAWREAFIFAPYYREVMTPMGVIGDTFETAIPWNAFEDFHRGINERVRAAIREVTGREGSLTCRFTHAYPDGPAPYFSFQGLGAGLDSSLDQWCELKLAANEAVTNLGGTITHHHAVGRDHRPRGYDRQRPDLFTKALAGAKAALDPNCVMNPGVLIDPASGPHVGGALSGRN